MDTKTVNIDEKIKAIMLLHALGDTIGFKNGEWEFNGFNEKVDFDYTNEIIYEFIDLGGVNGINLKDWNVSDDTFLHIAVAKALLKANKGINFDVKTFLSKSKKYFTIEYDNMIIDKENNKDRYIGITTEKSIKNKFKHDEYDKTGGGNGSAMRTPIIGAIFSTKDKYELLIETSMKNSQLTHNNSIGILAGFTIAYFIHLAMQKIHINKWAYKLIKAIEKPIIKKYFTTDDELSDYHNFLNQWYSYYAYKFTIPDKPNKTRADSNPIHRIRHFYELNKSNDNKLIGGSGHLCTIMAYDAVLMCDGKWEKLIVYSMLHIGDSDTIGAIAGALYGAIYDFGDVPKHMLKYIERRSELIKVSEELTKSFFNNE